MAERSVTPRGIKSYHKEDDGDTKPPHDGVHMERQLELHHGIAVICGLVIGSGIYVTPTGVIKGAGSVGLALVLWTVGGVIGILGALSFAELGATFPSSGEKYTYLEKMFGPFPAFLYLWMYLMFLRPGSNAIKCLIFGQYLLQPLFGDCEVPSAAVKLLAILVACGLTFVNIVNVKLSARGQTVSSLITVTALIIITVAGMIHLASGHTEHLENVFEGTSTDVGGIFVGWYSAIFSTWGWNALNFIVEELKNPYRNLPIAIMVSMVIVVGMYILVNMAYFAVLGPAGVLNSNAVAVSFAQKTLGGAAWIMPIFIACNTAGSFNSGTLVASRLCFVGARRGHLPGVLAMIHTQYLSPVTSLIFHLLLVILLISVGNLYSLLNNMVFANSLFDALATIGLVYMRWKRPDLHRPIKMPLVIPVVFSVCMLVLVGFPLVLKPLATAMGMTILLSTGVPYYAVVVLGLCPLTPFYKYYEQFLNKMQKLCLCVKTKTEVNF